MLIKLRLFLHLSLISLFFLYLAWILSDFHGHLRFLEMYVSADGHIQNPSLAIASIQIAFISLLFLSKISTEQIPLSPGKSPAGTLRPTILALLTLTCITLAADFGEPVPFIKEDGFFEWTTTICAALTSAFFFLTAKRKSDPLKRWLFLSLAAAFLFFAIEEISWGQRVFGWQTPSGLSLINHQGELNFHNIFNPILGIAYQAINLALAFFFFCIEKNRSLRRFLIRSFQIQTLTTPFFLRFFSVFFTLLSLLALGDGELTEASVAVLGLAFSHYCWELKSPSAVPLADHEAGPKRPEIL